MPGMQTECPLCGKQSDGCVCVIDYETRVEVWDAVTGQWSIIDYVVSEREKARTIVAACKAKDARDGVERRYRVSSAAITKEIWNG